MDEIIYVKLLDEGTEVFRPVKANHVKNNRYKIIDKSGVDEQWEFNYGEEVFCEKKLLEGEMVLVAFLPKEIG